MRRKDELKWFLVCVSRARAKTRTRWKIFRVARASSAATGASRGTEAGDAGRDHTARAHAGVQAGQT